MELQKELEKLKKYSGTEKYQKQFELIKTNFATKNDKKIIAHFVKASHKDYISEMDHFLSDTSIKIQLAEISTIVSMSYIAKTYFGKTRSWLHQRINADLINNKPAKFTDGEIQIFNYALKDIGKKISSTVIV